MDFTSYSLILPFWLKLSSQLRSRKVFRKNDSIRGVQLVRMTKVDFLSEQILQIHVIYALKSFVSRTSRKPLKKSSKSIQVCILRRRIRQYQIIKATRTYSPVSFHVFSVYRLFFREILVSFCSWESELLNHMKISRI